MLATRPLRAALVLAAVLMIPVMSAPPARAHSFLASTEPEQGARLAQTPEDVALQFSEEVAEDSVDVTVRTAGGEVVEHPRAGLESGGHVARLPLAPLDDGVYVVSWQVTSAVDGHESAGEFAFSVGAAAAGELPSSAVVVDVDRAAVAPTWLFFSGLALAAGGLAGSRVMRDDASRRRGWLRAGAGVALVGVGWQALFAGSALTGSAPLALVAATVALLLVMIAAGAASPLPGAASLAVAASVWATRSHSAATDGVAGWILDAVHLAVAAVWAGALAYVTFRLWRERADRSSLWRGITRYAQLAAVLIAVIAATGTIQALRLLPSVSALWTTGYGRILTVKSLLFAAALAAAAIARTRALPRQRPRLLRRLTTGEVGGVTGVLAAAALLVNAAPPQPDAAASLLGPPPMEGPVVHAMGMAGVLTVDVKAGDGRLDVEVLSTAGGVDEAEATLVARYPDGTGVELHPRPCGAGCYTQELTLPPGDTELTVTAGAPGWTGGTMTAQLHWPPPPAEPERFDDMVTAMRQVPVLQLTEFVSSGVSSGARTQAEMSGEEYVELMPWANGGVVDVRPLPDDDSGFSFYLPGSSMLFVVGMDEQGRLTEQRMVNLGHEVDYAFEYPD